jgi:hypothetical protein
MNNSSQQGPTNAYKNELCEGADEFSLSHKSGLPNFYLIDLKNA